MKLNSFEYGIIGREDFYFGRENAAIEGSQADFPAVIDLDSLDTSTGFILDGDMGNDRAGISVSNAGDVNGDGFDDIIIGANISSNGGSYVGNAYVVFGKASGFGTVDLVALDGTEGFVIQGAVEYDYAGSSVSSAGDVNGDGFDDIVIGAVGSENTSDHEDAGKTFVLFGKASGFGTVNLATITAADGFVILGDMPDDLAVNVSDAGDINGDGFADIIIGAPDGDDGGSFAGEAYVIFGKASGFGTIDLSALGPGDGFIIQGDLAGDRAGTGVSGIGDFNGDGIDDFAVGARGAPDGGKTYILFGKTTGLASIDLSSLVSTDGFFVEGGSPGDGAGWSVSGAGDVNGDGYGDVVVGAPANDAGGFGAGEAYVVFGKASGFSNVDLGALNGTDGFVIRGDSAYDFAGVSVSAAGDVNGDGFDDVIVGASLGSDGGNQAGEAYVVFGKASGFGTLDLGDIDGSNGFIIQGANSNDRAGTSVSGGGDINGDGFADVIVGAPNAFLTGRGYVIFGVAPQSAVTRIGSAADQAIRGGVFDDMLFGLGGEDVLYGGSGNDTLDGGTRADVLFGGFGLDTLLGGKGNDRLYGESGNDILNGGPDNDLLSGGPSNDVLIGGAGDDYLAGGSGIDTADYSGAPGAMTVDLLAGTATGDGNDTLTGIENVTGSAFDDLLYGDTGNNLLDGLGGEDFFDGRSGNDTLLGGSRADEMFGGSGDDAIEGQGGNDRANGGSGADTIDGGGGNDLLVGGPGDDVLIGGAGDDTMVGGSDDDRFVFAANSGADTIDGFQAGAGTDDVLDFTALGIAFGDLAIAQQGADTLITTPDGDTVLLTGVLPGQLDQASDFQF